MDLCILSIFQLLVGNSHENLEISDPGLYKRYGASPIYRKLVVVRTSRHVHGKLVRWINARKENKKMKNETLK